MNQNISTTCSRGVQGVLLGVSCLTAMFFGGCGKDEKATAPPPPVVEVMTVVQKDVPIHKEWVGVMDGSVNAVIRAQVTGYLVRQNYKDGDLVKKGQILFEIDPRTFQAALDQAKGILDQSKGDLARQEAAYSTARANLARIRPLTQKNALSQKDLDDATGRELAARASVDAAMAAVVAAAANVRKANLDLGFTRITSPVDGIAGIAKAQLGNLVGPNTPTELTSVSTVNPIKIYINVSEQEYLKARETNNNVEAIPLELVLADGSIYPHKGRFAMADRQIDPTTGTLKLGALFTNANHLLRPGGYSQIRALMTVKKGAILIPQRAVNELQGKYLVTVVDHDNKAATRPVKIAERIGSNWIIDEGLKPGERVVVEGAQKVKPGMPVTPKPFRAETAAAPEATAGAGKPTAPAAVEKR